MGDRVEVVAAGFERGIKGVITSVKKSHCMVRITQAGPSHNTVSMIGSTRRYKITDIRGI